MKDSENTHGIDYNTARAVTVGTRWEMIHHI